MLRSLVTDIFELAACLLLAAAAGFAAAQCWPWAAGTAASAVTLVACSVGLVLLP